MEQRPGEVIRLQDWQASIEKARPRAVEGFARRRDDSERLQQRAEDRARRETRQAVRRFARGALRLPRAIARVVREWFGG